VTIQVRVFRPIALEVTYACLGQVSTNLMSFPFKWV